MKAVAAVLLVLVLGACGTIAPPPARPPAIRTIGILPELPERLTIKTAGMTVFDSNEDKGDIAGWHLKPLVLDLVRSRLGRGREVVPVNYDEHGLEPGLDLRHWPDPEHDIGQRVQAALGNRGRADAYVVIEEISAQDPIGGTGLVYSGFGLYHRHSMFGGPIYVFALLRVTIVDGHTFEVLSTRDLGLPPDGKAAFRPVEGFAWAAHWSQYAPAQRQAVRRALQQLLSDGIDYTLAGMTLPR